jgi:hypothetical protein
MISMSSHSFTISIILLLAAIIATAVLNQWRSIKRYQRNIQSGLHFLSSFRQLLNLLQQHRGLSNGVISGDTSLKSRIAPLQAKISTQMTWLTHNNAWLANNPNWEGITEHWQLLSKRYESLDSISCISQHSKMIANLLYLIDDCSEYHKLYELKNEAGESIRYLWQEQLESAEWVGQARAVGTGVAATQRCSSVERIRLKYLHTAIDENLHQLNLSNDKKLTELLQVIDANLLSDRPEYSAENYFDLATEAIEQIYTNFDEQLMVLQQSYSTSATFTGTFAQAQMSR